MTWQKNLVALRSLRSEHHANNIEPSVINVTWNLGKRCNYDCSYCSPAIHDWVSPHHSIESINNFIGQINDWAIAHGKTFNMSLTGGEPFVHPNIIEILKTIKQASACGDQLVVVSNGSLPLELYEQSLEYLTHLTISLHLERSDAEITATLEKVITLNQRYPMHWFNVQVACIPEKFNFIENTVIPLLESNRVKFTLRRLAPWLNEVVDEWQTLTKKQILKKIYTIEQQTQAKAAEKKNWHERAMQVYTNEEFYTAEELEWFRTHIPETTWQNIGVWNSDLDYFETNSDIMVSNNHNQFCGWTCFIGIDSLYIDFNGLVYRGSCHGKGSIGKLGGTINFSNQPIICDRQVCRSNPDQTVRKAQPEFLHLITNS
jgi:molybdenum cofactor biosynthesis enzyme MoaA